MTTMISVELVPRSQQSILDDLDLLEQRVPAVSMVNIPDLMRFSLRSKEACALAVNRFERVVPHVRAVDFPVKNAARLVSSLRQYGIRDALIVRGDSPQDLCRPVYPTKSAQRIRALEELL